MIVALISAGLNAGPLVRDLKCGTISAGLKMWDKKSVLQESNLVRLATQQARRDEELNQARQRAAELEAEVADLSLEVELRQEQELTLKEVRGTLNPKPIKTSQTLVLCQKSNLRKISPNPI
jgi:hypothetical protein